MSFKDKFRLNKFVSEANRNMADFDEDEEQRQQQSARGEASDFHADLKPPPLKSSSGNGKAKAFDRPPSYMSATTPLETQFPHSLTQRYREPSSPRHQPVSPRDHCHNDRKSRRGGIWMPWSLFLLLALMLFLESTILFTYTVIGLYNNTPTSVFAWAGVPSVGIPTTYGFGACKQLEQLSPAPAPQPAINFAPNIVLPQAPPPSQQQHEPPTPAPPAVVTVTITPEPDPFSALLLSKILATTSSTTTTSSSSSSSTSTTETTSTDQTSIAAAIASEIASLLKNGTTSSGDPSVKTVTAPVPVALTTATVAPSAGLTTTIQMLTVDASGHIISPSSPTVTNSGSSTFTIVSSALSASTSPPPPPPPPTTVISVVPPSSPSSPATKTDKGESNAAAPTQSAKVKGEECPQNIWLVSTLCVRMVGSRNS